MFNSTALYDLTALRVFIAVNVAACIGAVLVLLPFTSSYKASISFFQLAELTFIYSIAHFIWFFGIAILGGPVWIAMHHWGLRHWIHAGLTGAFVMSIACLAFMTNFFTGRSNSLQSATRSAGQWIWIDNQLTAEGWANAIRSSLWAGLLGAMLGLVIWRIAYRRVVTRF